MRWIGRVAFVFWSLSTLSMPGSSREGAGVEYVGSMLCEAGTGEFLGQPATNLSCHNIRWRLTLATNQSTAPTFTIIARYRVATRSHPNRSEDGPEVTARGTWETLRGAKGHPNAVVYRLKAEGSERSLSFTKIGEHCLHLLTTDGSLAIGNGGWSYTLHRADRAEKLVDAAEASTAPDMSYQISPLAKGPSVFGVFEGRTPCHGISGELKMAQHAGCTKAKWRVTLFQNPETGVPTTYKIEGTLFRRTLREGSWATSRGTANNPNATVYALNGTDSQPALFLLKGDDNVLFFLNGTREPMVGNAEFSYTLNRRRE